MTAPPLTRRQRNRRAVKLLLAVFVVAGVIQAATRPKPLPVHPPDPQTLREQQASGDPVARCDAFLRKLDWSGVDTEKVTGAPSSIFGRAHWCLAHQGQF